MSNPSSGRSLFDLRHLAQHGIERRGQDHAGHRLDRVAADAARCRESIAEENALIQEIAKHHPCFARDAGDDGGGLGFAAEGL